MYEPDELVLKVRAATPVSHIRQVLAKRNQQLAFEPPQYAALFGNCTAEDTIGGIVACNLSGPRRILSGSVRDAVLGIEAVNGRGETFKGGGRTVKNVTGYDIPRILTGSFGVLAAITSITLKIHPAPAQEVTLVLTGLSDAEALQVLSGALRMPLDISAAVHLSGRSSDSVTALRLEGFSESVAARERELRKYLENMGPVTSMAGDESTAFWRRQRDLSDFAYPDPRPACGACSSLPPKPREWLLRSAARFSMTGAAPRSLSRRPRRAHEARPVPAEPGWRSRWQRLPVQGPSGPTPGPRHIPTPTQGPSGACRAHPLELRSQQRPQSRQARRGNSRSSLT